MSTAPAQAQAPAQAPAPAPAQAQAAWWWWPSWLRAAPVSAISAVSPSQPKKVYKHNLLAANDLFYGGATLRDIQVARDGLRHVSLPQDAAEKTYPSQSPLIEELLLKTPRIEPFDKKK